MSIVTSKGYKAYNSIEKSIKLYTLNLKKTVSKKMKRDKSFKYSIPEILAEAGKVYLHYYEEKYEKSSVDLWCRGNRVKEELKLIEIELKRIENHLAEDIERLNKAEFAEGFITEFPIAYTYARNQKIKKLLDFQTSNNESIKKWALLNE